MAFRKPNKVPITKTFNTRTEWGKRKHAKKVSQERFL